MLGVVGLGVIKLGSFAITFKLGHVSHIVERETVLRIKFVGLLEKAARLLALVAVQRGNPAQVQQSHLLFRVGLKIRNLLAHLFGIATRDFADWLATPVG